MALTNPDAKKKGIILILVVVAVVVLIAFLVAGASGIFGLIKAFIVIGFIVAFFGFVFYVVWWIFFKKKRIDIPFMNVKEYVQSAIENGSDMMDSLVLVGDKKHSPKMFMKIMGYLRVRIFNGDEVDMFVGKKKGFPMNLFEEWKVVCVSPKDHSDLIGDVYCNGFSLIKKWGYYWLHQTMMDFEWIDKSVTYDTYRTLVYSTLGDFKSIVDRSMGLDVEWSKEMKKEKVLKIPMLSGQQNQ